MAFTEDFTEFFDTGDFAETAIVATESISVIFDREWVVTNEAEGYRPVITYATADVAAVVGDSVSVDSGSYVIEILDSDGTGTTRAILRAV